MGVCIQMDPADNVATTLQVSKAGEELEIRNKAMECVGTVVPKADIPFAHKVVITDIPKDANVIKFGVPIGRASEHIGVGEYAHVHNIVSIRGSDNVLKKGGAKA